MLASDDRTLPILDQFGVAVSRQKKPDTRCRAFISFFNAGNSLDHWEKFIQTGFCVSVEHTCVILEEERVFDAGVPCALPAF